MVRQYIDDDRLPSRPRPFTATGKAVKAGLICRSGREKDLGAIRSKRLPSGVIRVVSKKRFSCADGSGVFKLKLRIRLRFDEWSRFTWHVIGGTKAYRGLRGCGVGTGEWLDGPPVYFRDDYHGKVGRSKRLCR